MHDLENDYGYRKSTGQAKCINCKWIDCKQLKNNYKPIELLCTELSNYCGEKVYISIKNICDLWCR